MLNEVHDLRDVNWHKGFQICEDLELPSALFNVVLLECFHGSDEIVSLLKDFECPLADLLAHDK